MRAFAPAGRSIELDPAEVEKALAVTAYGGFLVGAAGGAPHAAEAARRDPVHRRVREREGLCPVGALRHGQVRAARAWRKAWRASLRPQGIHVAHVVIDGGIKSARRPEPADKPDSLLDPDAIAADLSRTSSTSRAAPGRGRWSCGPGWRSFSAIAVAIEKRRAS